jgi:hypothetical protein
MALKTSGSSSTVSIAGLGIFFQDTPRSLFSGPVGAAALVFEAVGKVHASFFATPVAES